MHYARANCETLADAFAMISARLARLGHTTRAQRKDVLGVSDAALAAFEGGERYPTEIETEAIRSAFNAIGFSLHPDAFASLPLSV
jgi:hypothetical protein